MARRPLDGTPAMRPATGAAPVRARTSGAPSNVLLVERPAGARGRGGRRRGGDVHHRDDVELAEDGLVVVDGHVEGGLLVALLVERELVLGAGGVVLPRQLAGGRGAELGVALVHAGAGGVALDADLAEE